jgi:hypothetical protein
MKYAGLLSNFMVSYFVRNSYHSYIKNAYTKVGTPTMVCPQTSYTSHLEDQNKPDDMNTILSSLFIILYVLR